MKVKHFLIWLGLMALVWLFSTQQFSYAADGDKMLDFIKTTDRFWTNSWLDYSSNQSIVTYLYKLNMTKYNNVKEFRAYDWILRAEVVKFFVNFAKAKGFNNNYNENAKCNFTDIANVDSSLKPYIIESCKMWLFQGSRWKFNPYGKLTYWEALAVTLRMVDWVKLPESWKHWAMSYLKKAESYMMILMPIKYASSNPWQLNDTISRIDMWRLLEGADFIKKVLPKQTEQFMKDIR